MNKIAAVAALFVSLVFAVTAAANNSSPAGDPVAAQALALGAPAANPWLPGNFLPLDCRVHAQAVFWTANDWLLLARALAADASPCADYYVSIPPLSDDHKALRPLQDDLVRALGPRIHPVAEVTLGTLTGWASWVTGAPGRTWYDAGIEFRRRMDAAGYRSRSR